jgi:hypothetical protein
MLLVIYIFLDLINTQKMEHVTKIYSIRKNCTMGIGSFPMVKRPRRGVDHPPPSSAEVKERVELCLYSPSGP